MISYSIISDHLVGKPRGLYMPNIRLEVDGEVIQVFAMRDAKRYSPEPNNLRPRMRRQRETHSRIQRSHLHRANQDVFDIISYVDRLNRDHDPQERPKSFRLLWEGEPTEFYLTSKILRATLASRCKVEVMNSHGTYGWELIFR